MKALGLVFAAFVACAASEARAQLVTAGALVDQCKAPLARPDAPLDRMICLAYITAVADELSSQLQMCTPPGTTVGELRDVFLGWCAAQPDKRSMRTVVAASAVHAALLSAFPCKKKASTRDLEPQPKLLRISNDDHATMVAVEERVSRQQL
jgi:hypothetical protein